MDLSGVNTIWDNRKKYHGAFSGGGGGIRTPGGVAPTPVFKTGAFDHSATPPDMNARYPMTG